MPYYKNKNLKINVYTLINTQWTDSKGNQFTAARNDEGKKSQFLDENLRLQVQELYQSVENVNSCRIYPSKVVPGFIPARYDSATNLIVPDDDCDPLVFNSTFCVAVPTAAANAPQARKGTKVTLSSIYITGSVHKPEIPLSIENVANPSQIRCLNSLTNNQITYYLIYQQCRNQNEGLPKWREIFLMNGSNKVCPPNYRPSGLAGGNRVNDTLFIPVPNQQGGVDYTPVTYAKGLSRFTHPEMVLNTDSKNKFVLLSSYTLDLDQENSQFQFKIYDKLKVAPPDQGKKKYPVQTTFSNQSPNNTLDYVEGGAIYFVRCCYGVFNTLLVNGNNVGTGTTASLTNGSNANGAGNSYLDACKLYPNESYTMKVNYYDV